ncbi:MAG: hypothetical protein ACTS6J_25160 [Burkholderiales bacterium]
MSEPANVPEALPKAQAATATLLCVGDESNILSSMRRLFRQDGYRVLVATGGLEGFHCHNCRSAAGRREIKKPGVL